MNVSANPVVKELSVKTHPGDIVASVHQDFLEIQILLVKEKLRLFNVPCPSHAQVEKYALKENVFAREGFRGNPLDCAEILTSVLKPLP